MGKVIAETKEPFERIKVEKPDLEQMWETFIKIPDLFQMWLAFEKNPTEDKIAKINNCVCNMIRFKIYPLISLLRNNGVIDWYCFLIHDRNYGVPTSEDDNNLYFHIRFEVKKDVNLNQFLISLPNYCVMTRRISPRMVESINGIDKALLKNEEIEEAWRIIGEQSEWLLNMLNTHKEDVDIPFKQVAQFLHYYFNMTFNITPQAVW